MKNRREFLQIGLAAAMPAAADAPRTPVKHIIVLMLENRSFDHMLGFSGIPGTEMPGDLAEVDSAGQKVTPTPNGVISGAEGVDPDPDHDFAAVMWQMYGKPGY